MQKRFIIPTVQDRIKDLRALLLSMQRYRRDWEFVIVAQKYSMYEQSELLEFTTKLRLKHTLIFIDDGIGPGRARRIALEAFERNPDNVWVSLDDDMIVTAKTHFNKLAEIVSERRDIGLLSSAWVRSRQQEESKVLSDKLVKQPIVYTGGGLAFRDDFVVDFLDSTPDELWLFDNVAWSLASYISGYENYRYLGSVSIHNACARGGRRDWVYQGKRVLPDETLIRVRPATNNKQELAVGNCWHICESRDLTDKAKALHKLAKERRTGHG